MHHSLEHIVADLGTAVDLARDKFITLDEHECACPRPDDDISPRDNRSVGCANGEFGPPFNGIVVDASPDEQRNCDQDRGQGHKVQWAKLVQWNAGHDRCIGLLLILFAMLFFVFFPGIQFGLLLIGITLDHALFVFDLKVLEFVRLK
ncbi:uncharacterized protein N7511_008850 [Penicillium nucicola]|uniref:uncharacterized protein n=1 Tax=Penicillium nucicola TaxID=1850975 RepID=UPI0025454B4C|nr:uncharacterized protein N7511_008850 [Penicillium nucicola]KAJ5747154.1 hypothetical protein N7511_008850 [Penicillium nucicola]